MKYQVGDKVVLLHSKEEGIILEILDQQMARVLVDGVDFPVYLDQLDFPYYYQFSKKHQHNRPIPAAPNLPLSEIPKEKYTGTKAVLDRGLQLVFFPILHPDEADFLVDRFKVYLSNGLRYSFSFSYCYRKKGQEHWSQSGLSQSDTDFYLHDILFEDFSDNPIFQFTCKPLNGLENLKEEFATIIRIKPRQLFEQLEKVRLQKLASFSLMIFENFPLKDESTVLPEIQLKSAVSTSSILSKSQKDFEDSFSHIIDLHIENLLPDWKGLSNFEILKIQLDHFDQVVERTLRNQQPILIVIHGVGEGKLKNEIHHLLKQMKEVRLFENRSDPRFGQGATTIYFQY